MLVICDLKSRLKIIFLKYSEISTFSTPVALHRATNKNNKKTPHLIPLLIFFSPCADNMILTKFDADWMTS